MTRVMVLGASGAFGRLCCRRLLRIRSLTLILVARDAGRLADLVRELRARAAAPAIETFAFDLSLDPSTLFVRTRPSIVIHAAGPFQEPERRVAEAAIEHGCHYLDLADGRDFVAGFSALDARAQAAGVLAVTGASSVPALSSAVVDHLAQEMAAVRRIETGISPGNRSTRGLAVVEAILSYAGEPFVWLRDGQPEKRFGWQGLRRRKMPGLGWRWFCDCDVPDLALFPDRYDGLRSLCFRAGLELSLLHLGLWGLAALRRWRLLPNLRRFARLLHWLSNRFSGLGTDRGGMYLEVHGIAADGTARRRNWSLTAGSGHGPFVPVLASVILVRKFLAGDLSQCGAMACLGLLTLAEFEAEWADLDIETEEA